MEDFLREVRQWAQMGLLAAFGGAASYLYTMVTKNKKFVWLTFNINLFLAFFVGQSLGGFIPPDTKNFGGWLMMLGFCAYPALGLVENKVLAYLDKRMGARGE
jgi:fluoride ion exporter CrcB/FEX